MNVLVIYNTIPDEVKMAIVDMSLAEYNYFSKCKLFVTFLWYAFL